MPNLVGSALSLSAALLPVLVTGCANTVAPSSDKRAVPLEAVLNQMKCELAMSFNSLDRSKLDLTGWYIDGKLTAKIISSNEFTASASTPELVPLGSGVSGGFSLGTTVTHSNTQNTIMDFIVSPIATNINVCNQPRSPGIDRVQDLGIYKWFQTINRTHKGQPLIAVTTLNYTLDFGVKRVGHAGADIAIQPITLSANDLASRDDTQQLALTLTPGDPAKAAARKVISKSSSPFVITTPGGGNIGLFNVPGKDTTQFEAIEQSFKHK